jgi:hypothetical protein
MAPDLVPFSLPATDCTGQGILFLFKAQNCSYKFGSALFTQFVGFDGWLSITWLVILNSP